MIKATLFADTKCILGEGSWYDGKNSKLYWLDIFGCKVFVHDFKAADTKVYQLDKFVTTIVPKEDGTGFVLGMRDGVYECDNNQNEKGNVMIERRAPAVKEAVGANHENGSFHDQQQEVEKIKKRHIHYSCRPFQRT